MYMYGMGSGGSLSLILFVASILVTLIAQARVNGAYNKYSKVRAMSGMTGAQVARKILDDHGLRSVSVNQVRGKLSDHYDPRNKSVNLSSTIYSGTSIASISVAAHEVGHAIQDQEDYSYMRLRHSILPAANIGSKFGYVAIFLGFILGLEGIGNMVFWLGIYLMMGIVLFQLVTLPVEFNASNRAIDELGRLYIVHGDEEKYVKNMLGAAALTYVAALASTVLQILRLIIIANGRRRD